ncbi:ferredoxin [Pseudonocardia endophytica]|uniref:Ferredoxin n=1 Tax=Pseudonocardia endophytica TaxID=401976 RepID=A0A4R1HLM8_PSEEN|nr:ferredoxin [Pseudonocardia endophytica]TCK21415.1 ferredoxin [Pseudonocardia endophytica]
MAAGRRARVDVDTDSCVYTLQCTYYAPTVFDVDEHGEMVFTPHLPAEAVEAAEYAAELCPSRAIRVTRHTAPPSRSNQE